MYNSERILKSQKERYKKMRQLARDIQDTAHLLQILRNSHDCVVLSGQMRDKALELRRESAIYYTIESFWEN